MKVQIVFFSGTGCTAHVAKSIANEFEARGHFVAFNNLSHPSSVQDGYDLLIACFVVHACNAPAPVLQWAKGLDQVRGIPAVIVSVSGGGEVTPNLACRIPLKRILKRKKYQVIYEKMIVMPSNWIIETKPILNSKLIQVLPFKVSFLVNDILHGKKHLIHPLLGNRILTLLGRLEHKGSHYFGKRIAIADTCTSCSKCSRECPVGNITILGGKPVFGDCCVLCLNCIYTCPQNALKPQFGKFAVIKTGFSLEKVLQLPISEEKIDLDIEAKGYAWLGIKRYLSNTVDILTPVYNKKAD